MSKTLEELRTELAGAVSRLFTGTATGGSTTTIVDAYGLTRFDENNALLGALAYIKDTTDDLAPEGEARHVYAYSATAYTITVDRAFSLTVGAGDIYELYLAPLELEQWDGCINDAIRSAYPELLETATLDTNPTGANTYAMASTVDRVLGAEITFKSALVGYPSQPLPQWYTSGEPGDLDLHLSRPVPTSSDMQIRILTGTRYAELAAGESTDLDPQYILDAARVQFYQRMADASRQSDRGGFLQLMAHWQEKAEQRKLALAAAQLGHQQQAPRKEKR